MKILFMGTPDFAVPSLEKIHNSKHTLVGVVTSQDNMKASPKHQKSAVKNFAIEKKLTLFQPSNLDEPAFHRELIDLSPDLIIVVAFKLLPKEIWQIPKFGTINLHASLLPNYRGAAPINWAIINGEKETGVTTFFIDEKIDTGAIILQKKEKIEDEETFTTLYDRLKNIGSELIMETISAVENNTISTVIQKHETSVHLAPKIHPKDCEIDWYHKNNSAIVNFVRGLADSPGAFSLLNGGKIKIFELKEQLNEEKQLAPGEIFISKSNDILVGTCEGCLQITSLQIEGKKRMSSGDFVKGNRIEGFFSLKNKI